MVTNAARHDVLAVRALAHPLRLDLLDLLRFEGPSTATLLAERLGESTGSTSYHLRMLAKYGYIHDVSRPGGRERFWAYRERQLTVNNDEAASRDLLAQLLTREAHALDRYLASPIRATEWDAAAFFQSQAFRLTRTELDEVRRSIEALFSRLRRADADAAPPDARSVRISAFGFPMALKEHDE